MEEAKDPNYSLCLEIIDHIKTTYNWFNEGDEGFARIWIVPNHEDLDGTSTQRILFSFPSEIEYYKISLEELVKLSPEIRSLEIVSPSVIMTKNRRYYIVSSNDANHDFILKRFNNLKTVSKEGINLDVVKDSFLVGLAATDMNLYDHSMWGTFSPYLAVEVICEDDKATLSREQELNLVKSYIFEISDSTGIALDFSRMGIPFGSYDYEEIQAQQGSKTENLREIEEFNEGMALFVSAMQIQDDELKFLNFYKILEHYAPIAVNIEANELMRKKLDAPRNSFQDGNFIHSIFALAKSMKERFNDEDLIKSTFNLCFDFIGQFDKLPESIKKKIKKEIGAQSLSYSTDKQKVATASNMVGKIIYATRNKVVHAKSNYQTTGVECDSNDLYEFNEFMKEICSQTIRWYNRLPQHLKLTVIE